MTYKLSDRDAMDAIHGVMDEAEWNADLWDRVSEIVFRISSLATVNLLVRQSERLATGEQATGKAFKRYRALARRRYNAEDYVGVIDAVEKWNHYMYDHPDAPFPDDWADMDRLEQDARFKLRCSGR